MENLNEKVGSHPWIARRVVLTCITKFENIDWDNTPKQAV